jgi:hypothetical protein
MSKRSTVYEWVIEAIDEHGDIVDVDHRESRAEAEASIAGATGRHDIGLTRDVFDEVDGLIDRTWAYLQPDGTLPEYFSESGGAETRHKVPTRFRKEATS